MCVCVFVTVQCAREASAAAALTRAHIILLYSKYIRVFAAVGEKKIVGQFTTHTHTHIQYDRRTHTYVYSIYSK